MNLRKEITERGQPYFDEPVYVRPLHETRVRVAIRDSLKKSSTAPPAILLGHRRVWLNWVDEK